MSSFSVSLPGTGRWPWLAWLIGSVVLLACALNAGLLSAPIELWDESRNVVNALEMQRTGLSLVTQYGFQPDLWNTKPPLMIWLMVLSAHLFGSSIWALRLPALLAGFATVALVVDFTWRITRSRLTAALAGLLLAASSGFYGQHAVATADYDSLLTCLTTAYLLQILFILHRRRPPTRALVLVGVLASAAVLTKSIEGLVPVAGVALYLVALRRWARPFTSPAHLWGLVTLLVLAGGYYVAREAVGHGYWAAVAHNELGGRYLQTIGAHHAPWWYYLQMVTARRGTFSLGALVWLAPLAMLISRPRERLALGYVVSLQLGIIAVFSVAATKLPWYLIPAYPFMAIRCARCIPQAPRSRAAAGLPAHRLRPWPCTRWSCGWLPVHSILPAARQAGGPRCHRRRACPAPLPLSCC